MNSPRSTKMESTKPAWPPQSGHAMDKDLDTPSKVIISYLRERVPGFRQLRELQQRGWDNPMGDEYFKRQREKADKSTEKDKIFFYGLMQRIGTEVDQVTRAFHINNTNSSQARVLDMCVAPGGFLDTVLRLNPGAHAVGFSLPMSQGGHEVLLSKLVPNVDLRYMDITMLAADMGVSDIPKDHPDCDSFLPRQFEPTQTFDLVLCDGHVLRTHPRADYREKREARRLTLTQLALGLEHLKPGGTMVVLLHKLELWSTVSLIYTFSRFASVQLFKPTSGHTTRSSFYMVSTQIQSQKPEAVLAIHKWKAMWIIATFGTDDEYVAAICHDDGEVDHVLGNFGAELVRLGKNVWNTQVNALARASFVR